MTVALVEVVRRAPRQGAAALAISDGDLVDRPWLRRALDRAGLRLVVAGALPVERALESAGPAAAVLVVIGAGARQGVRLEEYIAARAAAVRGASAHVGLLVVAEGPCSPSLLPARTWVVAAGQREADVRPMVEAVRANLLDRVEAQRVWPPLREAARPREGRQPAAPPRCVPNFNVRHPAMLVPIARVAAALGTPAFCEISPQEALTHHRGAAGGRDPGRAVAAVLEALRVHVDRVRAATGADLWLHLDHCDDPELISRALDAGFDSIMADGSDRPLALNIAFTRRAVERARGYGVPVEGEVGSIDPSGRRRTSRSEPADVATYVAETGVDFVGVNVGQVHGSDYAFNRARRAIRELADLDRVHRGGDARSLYDACRDLDAELAAAGVSRSQADRRALHALRDRLVDDPAAAAEDLLANAYRAAGVASWTVLARLEHDWHRRRAGLAARRRRLCARVVGPQPRLGDGPARQPYIDVPLLQEVTRGLAGRGTRVVLHGGSSIAHDDLRLLDRLGVARVNFGSAPFSAFLTALAARAPGGGPAARPDGLVSVLRFLDEHANDWETWLDGSGPALDAYEEQLRRRYFLPLQGRAEAEA
ncbi:MAG TPA: class II fructose-bisphosphate aldolase [Candidatus Dormibacteraeota bacterium]|nr:class II fructose-bisphosphate aldolase [Candidatus Dormibacteraeota bacterium]